MKTATDLRNEGIRRAIRSANRNKSGWSTDAFQFLIGFISDIPKGTNFQAEDVRLVAIDCGLPKPPSARAWGGIMRKAQKMKLIKSVGTQQTTLPRAHHAIANVWIKL